MNTEYSNVCPFMIKASSTKVGTYSRPPHRYLIMEKQKVWISGLV